MRKPPLPPPPPHTHTQRATTNIQQYRGLNACIVHLQPFLLQVLSHAQMMQLSVDAVCPSLWLTSSCWSSLAQVGHAKKNPFSSHWSSTGTGTAEGHHSWEQQPCSHPALWGGIRCVRPHATQPPAIRPPSLSLTCCEVHADTLSSGKHMSRLAAQNPVSTTDPMQQTPVMVQCQYTGHGCHPARLHDKRFWPNTILGLAVTTQMLTAGA